MKAVSSVILSTDRNYNNKEGVNGIEYVVNVSIDNVESINRSATVIVAPLGSSLDPGDEVIVHHNIMRENIHVNDKKVNSNFFLGNGFYRCPVSEVIMKKNKSGDWDPLSDFLFLRPIKEENVELEHGLVLVPYSRKGMKDLRAEIAITNKNLKGASVGDTIIFSRNSEHEFIIDGEVLYKCRIEDILGKEE